MTPQLQQAIKLLQLSSQELETQLLEAMEANPLLEREDLMAMDGEAEAESSPDTAAETDTATEAAAPDEGLDRMPAEEERWDNYYSSMPSAAPAATSRREDFGDRTMEQADRDSEGLHEHLLWQLNLSRASSRDTAIGVAIIDAINDDGYLTETLEDIRESLLPDRDVGLDEVRAVLHQIQHYDPMGCAASSVRECLQIQLSMMSDETPGYAAAGAIVDDYLELLARQDVPALRRKLDLSQDDLKTAIELVRSLEPRPGAAIASSDVEYVRPDVVVRKAAGTWIATLPDDLIPRLRINNFYANLIGEATKEDANYLRGQLQEARWLIKSLEARNETLLKVANAIVSHQTGFLENGPEAMKPLVLREIADIIDMHESTVSRVTTRKYMLTPRGVFEFKYFFSSHVGTNDGGECSATAIQAMIAKLIEEEPNARPLSDSKISNILNERGIDVARRTVAKYREGMGIASSSKRKRLI